MSVAPPHSVIDNAEDPEYCRVCFDASNEDVNPIVFCDNFDFGCRNCFHADCYLRGKVPPGKFLCDLCKFHSRSRTLNSTRLVTESGALENLSSFFQTQSSLRCAMCFGTDGALKFIELRPHSQHFVCIHASCAIWLSEDLSIDPSNLVFLYSPSDCPAVESMSDTASTTMTIDSAQSVDARSLTSANSESDQTSLIKSRPSDAIFPPISTCIDLFTQRSDQLRHCYDSQPCIVCGGCLGARVCCQHVDASGAQCNHVMHVLCGLREGFAMQIDMRQAEWRMAVRCSTHIPANFEVALHRRIFPLPKDEAAMSILKLPPLPIMRGISGVDANDQDIVSSLFTLGDDNAASRIAAMLNMPAPIELPDKYMRVRIPGVSECILPSHEFRPACDALSIAAIIEDFLDSRVDSMMLEALYDACQVVTNVTHRSKRPSKSAPASKFASGTEMLDRVASKSHASVFAPLVQQPAAPPAGVNQQSSTWPQWSCSPTWLPAQVRSLAALSCDTDDAGELVYQNWLPKHCNYVEEVGSLSCVQSPPPATSAASRITSKSSVRARADLPMSPLSASSTSALLRLAGDSVSCASTPIGSANSQPMAAEPTWSAAVSEQPKMSPSSMLLALFCSRFSTRFVLRVAQQFLCTRHLSTELSISSESPHCQQCSALLILRGLCTSCGARQVKVTPQPSLLPIAMVTIEERMLTCSRILGFISNLADEYASNSRMSSQFFQNAGDVMFLLRHTVRLAESSALSLQALEICRFVYDKVSARQASDPIAIADMGPAAFLAYCEMIHALCGLGWISLADLQPLLVQMREYIQVNPIEDFTSSLWNPRSASLPAVPRGYCSHCGYIDKRSKQSADSSQSAKLDDELKKMQKDSLWYRGSKLSYWALHNLPSPIVPSSEADTDIKTEDAQSSSASPPAQSAVSPMLPSPSSSGKKPNKRVRLVEPPSVNDERPCLFCNLISLNKLERGNVCDALVWSSVFADLGLESIGASHFTLFQVLKHVACNLRPYKSLEELGEAQFRFQCYFLTHLLFIASSWDTQCWGAAPLPRSLFLEEYAFLRANLQTVVALRDVELVGEFVHCFRLLQVPDDDLSLQLAVRYLLIQEDENGRTGQCLGRQELSTRKEKFYYQYHAAWTTLAALLPSKTYPWANGPDTLVHGVWSKYVSCFL